MEVGHKFVSRFVHSQRPLLSYALRFSPTDEPKVIISSRQLAHSCSQYEDSVADLLNLLQRTPGETDQRIQRICDQIQNDTRLMKEIVDETNSIAKSTAKHGQVINTLKTLFTGRLENIKELESQLLSRVHMISLEFIRLQVITCSYCRNVRTFC